MIVEAQATINGNKEAIWAAITNIKKASETISGIENIEILDKPAIGLVGLKWRETRMLFGKPAIAEKWITDAAETHFSIRVFTRVAHVNNRYACHSTLYGVTRDGQWSRHESTSHQPAQTPAFGGNIS